MRVPRSVRGLLVAAAAVPVSAQSFVNWETPHVSPLALAPDGSRLLAVNTADARLEVFDLAGATPVPEASIPVGLDPVSVRFHPDDATRAFVVNHVSDDVSVVDLETQNVVATLPTDDEPADVVFAGSPLRAFVSCSQADTVLVFDPAELDAPPVRIPVLGEDPRAMAVSADGARVYVAVFESGNRSTVLGGGSTMAGGFPENVVGLPSGPHGGVNPPPNDGAAFDPPIAAGLPAPPAVGLIVKRDALGRWMDDNGGDWTDLVSGSDADESGRPVGWDLPDRDLAVIDADALTVEYASGLMNVCMALSVEPTSGEVTVVGTDATNEVRFEPVLQGTFLRVMLARVDPDALGGPERLALTDLNPHLTYAVPTIPQGQRDLSLGDPRGIAWSPDGTTAWVTGMGSNNVVALTASGARASAAPIEVGEGPTGIVHDAARDRLYVLDKFEGALSVVDPGAEVETARVPFFDPSPAAIRDGRKHVYDTHRNSGLGQIACASCHVDTRMDRLAWDLGDPSGSMKVLANVNLGANIPGLAGSFEDWHPMKGPMTTQTLQDIVGKEPHHWRGDRDGLEEFAGAFVGLQGDDVQPSPADMQEFEDFLATIHFPPNPFRELDDTLPADLPLPGHFTPGRFGPAGLPLPNGDAQRGLDLFRPPNLLDAVACVTCHTLPTGVGTDHVLPGLFQPLVPLPTGPNGEVRTALVSIDGSTNVTIKVPQLRNLYEKVGFEMTQVENEAGFGFLHDGSVDSIARFVSEPVFGVQSVQDVADLVAFMLAFSGGGLPGGSTDVLDLEPPGVPGNHTHAAVGRRVTVADPTPTAADAALLDALVALSDANAIGLVAKGRRAAVARGWTHVGGGLFQSDRAFETATRAELEATAGPGREVTFTAVPLGTETRLGLDRDEDGAFDRDEVDAGFDPADAASVPPPCAAVPPAAPTGLVAAGHGKHAVRLDWSDASSDELGFIVSRRDPGPDSIFVDVATLPAGTTQFTDEDLPCTTRFVYRVRAWNCAGARTSVRAEARTGFCARVGLEKPLTTSKK